jgi:hypothetical protein
MRSSSDQRNPARRDTRQLDYRAKPTNIRETVYLSHPYETEVLEHLRSDHEERRRSS